MDSPLTWRGLARLDKFFTTFTRHRTKLHVVPSKHIFVSEPHINTQIPYYVSFTPFILCLIGCIFTLRHTFSDDNQIPIYVLSYAFVSAVAILVFLCSHTILHYDSEELKVFLNQIILLERKITSQISAEGFSDNLYTLLRKG